MPVRLACRVGAALLAALLGTSLATAAPIDTVRACADTAANAVGIKDLEAACPGLEASLQALGFERTLYEGWRERLNRDSLRDLVGLEASYRGATPAAPLVSALPEILAALAGELNATPRSWWDAVTAWLRAWLKSHDADSFSWLDHWLENLQQSATLWHAILYSLIGLVMMIAAWVVFNELKAAGVTGKRKPDPAAPRVRAMEDSIGASPALTPVAAAEQLSALLRLLVQRLLQAGRLKAERALTHRELVLGSSFDSESQRAAFAAVAATAESVLYGARGASPEHLRSVLQQGHALLAELPDPPSVR
jgi:Domain of unknown function (DUF4129)